ncbi:hypothetical protein AWB78_06537 [Caballeronia calidae]|uniref:Uncharacterized protein n=1 Tax=Caballeronia calidae TaxID=1777139 RepID=A0A158E8H5_9BURK|nr:hypothetical protein AWB78_06537 [Caballeronia calidae]
MTVIELTTVVGPEASRVHLARRVIQNPDDSAVPMSEPVFYWQPRGFLTVSLLATAVTPGRTLPNNSKKEG